MLKWLEKLQRLQAFTLTDFFQRIAKHGGKIVKLNRGHSFKLTREFSKIAKILAQEYRSFVFTLYPFLSLDS